MANPQPTDAHLRIAHSINEAIMLRDFSKHQRKILDLILRLSWGCAKKYAYIPLQKDFQVAGLYEPDIKKELEWLTTSKIIHREGPFYWFNKDFDQWQISRTKTGTPQELQTKLSELLRINLNGNEPLSELLSQHPKLSEFLSGDLGKHEVNTLEITKFATPNLRTLKEKERKEDKDIDISGQSIKRSILIAQGKILGVKERRVTYFQKELDRLKIEWRE